MSPTQTNILHEAEGESTVLEVPMGYTAVVFSPEGKLDIAVLPAEDGLEKDEAGYPVANDGMMKFMALMMAMEDPEVKALVEYKMAQERPKA